MSVTHRRPDLRGQVRGGRRTPAKLYRLFGNRLLRAVFGWDRPRHDLRLVPTGEQSVCLEVGSGGGFYTRPLARRLGAGSLLIALDPDLAGLGALRDSVGDHLDSSAAALRYLQGDGCELGLRDGTVDTVFFGYSLEEVGDPLACIREANRILRVGGTLVLFVWRPAFTASRRRPVFALVHELFDTACVRNGPQNLRSVWTKVAAVPQATTAATASGPVGADGAGGRVGAHHS